MMVPMHQITNGRPAKHLLSKARCQERRNVWVRKDRREVSSYDSMLQYGRTTRFFCESTLSSSLNIPQLCRGCTNRLCTVVQGDGPFLRVSALFPAYPPPRAVGPFLCVASGKPSQKGLQKKNKEGPLHPFLKVVCGQGSTSTRADRVCLSPPRLNERRCNTASGRVQRESATSAAGQLLSCGTVQGQDTPRKLESTSGIRDFDGGLGRYREDTGTSSAVVRKTGTLVTKHTLSRAEGTRLTPDIAANVPSGVVTSATVAENSLHPDEAGKLGVAAASRKGESSSDGRAAFDGRSKALETAAWASSSEPMSRLAGRRQGVSEGARKETGGTAADGQSGLFPPAVAARDSSCSDKGEQGGEARGVGRRYSFRKKNRSVDVDEGVASELARGTVSSVQPFGLLGTRQKISLERGKVNQPGG